MIGAWVEAASLLTDLGMKKKKVMFYYHGGNSDPVGGASAVSQKDAQAVADILIKMQAEADVISGKAFIPRFTFF